MKNRGLASHNKVKLYRLRQGWSAPKLAEVMEISGTHLYNIESGHQDNTPSLPTALKLSYMLGVSVNKLFKLTPQAEASLEIRRKRYEKTDNKR